MPAPLTGYINTWRGGYSDISNTLWSLGSYLQNAGNALKIQQFVSAGNNLINAKDAAHSASQYFKLGGSNMYDNMYAAMHWIDENIGGGTTLDMEAILAAIWDSNKLETFQFINYIDAMRASIWNTEIYESHLQDWYRHFSI